MFKSNKGFTLVELIVVIAILAILAGVAVPAYSGYIKKAESAADITKLDAVKTAVQSAHATTTQPTKIVVTDNDNSTDLIKVGNSTSVDEMADTVLADFMLYYGVADGDGKFSIDLTSGTTATWENGTWTIN